jgi:hypothetical protein
MPNPDRQVLRQVYFDAWTKAQNNVPLLALEQIIVTVILEHPEYHSIFNGTAHSCVTSKHSEAFFHLGLHVAIVEQVAANHPAGIAEIYQQLLAKNPDPHLVQHKLMDCLANTLQKAQYNHLALDPQHYIQALSQLN